MGFISTILLVFLLQAAEPQRHQLDLEPLLRDSAALQKLKILYEPPSPKSYQAFFAYGDGSLVWQAYPRRPMSLLEVPTCRSRVSPYKVKNLVSLIVQKRFFDLPEKRFLFVSVAQGKEELELHTIAIDDGIGKASRTFGIGEYAGKVETIPPEFSAIEQELKQLKDSAFPPSEKTCHLARAVNSWN